MTSSQYKGKRITITFPVDLYEKIRIASEEENRTFSQQTVQMCKEAFKARESDSKE